MSEKTFEIGQTVYIQGWWKAVVREIYADGHLGCDVYEGLPEIDPVPTRYTYDTRFLEAEKRNH